METKTFTCINCGKEVSTTNKYLRKFCSDECRREYYQNQAKQKRAETRNVVRKCVICGKEFTVRSEKTRKQTCSDECRAIYTKQYLSQYVKNRAKTDKKFVERRLASTSKSSQRQYANKMWNSRLQDADVIIYLATQDNAREAIAKYLDLNFQKRLTVSTRKAKAEGEENAEKVLLKSLNNYVGSE